MSFRWLYPNWEQDKKRPKETNGVAVRHLVIWCGPPRKKKK